MAPMSTPTTRFTRSARFAIAALAVAAVALAAAQPAAGQGGAGDADQPLVVITGSAEERENETVDGLFVVDADTEIAGTVSGDAVVVAGRTTVSGTVDGDLVTLTGPAELLAGAEVEGDLIYGDEEPELAAAADVGGELRDQGWNWDDVSGVLPLIGGIAIWIAMSISALVLGLSLIAFAPRAADAAHRPGARLPRLARRRALRPRRPGAGRPPHPLGPRRLLGRRTGGGLKPATFVHWVVASRWQGMFVVMSTSFHGRKGRAMHGCRGPRMDERGHASP